MKKIILPLIFAAAIIIPGSCSSTQITGVWKDENYKSGFFKKIVVVALFDNLTTRQTLEYSITSALKESGNDAVSSLKFMAPNVQYKYADMEKLFDQNGIDGILIINLKSIDKKQTYVQGSVYYAPEAYYYVYNSYYTMYTARQEPGYIDEKDIVTIQTNLYQNSNDKLIWSAESKTIESYQTKEGLVNPQQEGPEIAKLIINQLKTNGMIR